MGIIAEAVKHMLAAGMTPEAVVAAVEAMEQSATPPRTARQERNRRYYEKKSVLKRLKASYSDDSDVLDAPSPPLSPPLFPLPDLPLSPPLNPPHSVGTHAVKKSNQSTRGTRLPADWMIPDEWAAWAFSKYRWTMQRVREEADRFRDWWIAQPGQKGVKLDWYATWRTWCDRASVSRYPSRPASNPVRMGVQTL